MILVQDANIQTDTPVMSEDDNTTGAEDCSFSTTIINHTDDTSVMTVPSTSYQDICHNISSITDISLNSSLANQSNDQFNRTDSGFESSSGITHSVIESHQSPEAADELQPVMQYQQTLQTDVIEPHRYVQPQPIHVPSPVQIEPENLCNDSLHIEPIAVKSYAPDLSGLELLSNSIEAYEKNIFIKQEPQDKPEVTYNTDMALISTENVNMIEVTQAKEFRSNNDEPLGGLNLLCALAEQRFQEEVGRGRKRSSSSEGSDSKKQKRHHKEKHSSKKSGKRSKHSKDRKDRKSRHQQQPSDDDELVKQDLSETFNRVKASYTTCSCKNDDTADGNSGCCRERCNWPTAEEMYTAMNTDMRNRLAKMAKEVQEEKRKLDEIKSLEKGQQSSDRESTPLSSSSYYCVDNRSMQESSNNESPVQSLLALSEKNLAEYSKQPSDSDSLYRFDDADTNSSSSSKRKTENLMEASQQATEAGSKKAKSLVGYIFASKKRLNDAKHENSTSATDEGASVHSDGMPIFTATIKQENADNENACDQGLFGNNNEKRLHKSKHPSKHKKSKSKERKHRRTTESRERKRRIDSRCTLTSEHLDSLTNKSSSRVLTAMGGLFYAGCLSAIQPPDVYAVTLDGERGNRPHIMSREEILRDAVSLLIAITLEFCFIIVIICLDH